ncbi:AAA family ATPase [Vibrio fortis]|uniref:AAA family ATPase n=1 Tax=Vibrio fortis TaxID=212667 RepID=A0A5N3QUX1_9VIBR|nr:deoxynucleoside kinase [Vibrio fortis]KAB0285451.1 AAA family ATPase [Vibrio fortis]
MYIAIEGNIGAGKSTILHPLAERLGFEIIEEGIETDKGFQDCLAAFYKTGSKEDFDALQHYLATYRANLIQQLDPNKNYIMERSLQGAALFCLAENHTDTATWTLQSFKHVPQPSHYVFLDCDAAICAERINQRGRECESEIPLEYLERVERAHRDWAYMGEWAGTVTVVDSSGHIQLEELAGRIETALLIKAGVYVSHV